MSKMSRRQLAKKMVDQLEAGKLSTKKAARLLAAYLMSERRTAEAHLLINDIAAELEQRGTTTVQVETVSKLSSSVENELAKLFKGKTDAKHAVVEQTPNENLLGGLRARTAELELDLSVRSKLNSLKAKA